MASHSNKKKQEKKKLKDLTIEELLGEQRFYSSYTEQPKSRNLSIKEVLRQHPFYKQPKKNQKENEKNKVI